MPEDVELLRARARSLAQTHEDFKASLVEMRKRHGLTQPQVAELLGVSQAAISKFESYDSNPTLSSIRRYALAIGATLRLEVVDDLATEPEDAAASTTPMDTWTMIATVAKSTTLPSASTRHADAARWLTAGAWVSND